MRLNINKNVSRKVRAGKGVNRDLYDTSVGSVISVRDMVFIVQNEELTEVCGKALFALLSQ
jgi:hypothetical protein